MINKIERFYLFLAAFLWCGLVALFTYGDLEFSRSLANAQASWAVWLERLGEFPGVLTAWLASAIVLARGIWAERREEGQRWCLVIGLLALLCLSIYIPNRYSYYFWESRPVSFPEWRMGYVSAYGGCFTGGWQGGGEKGGLCPAGFRGDHVDSLYHKGDLGAGSISGDAGQF